MQILSPSQLTDLLMGWCDHCASFSPVAVKGHFTILASNRRVRRRGGRSPLVWFWGLLSGVPGRGNRWQASQSSGSKELCGRHQRLFRNKTTTCLLACMRHDLYLVKYKARVFSWTFWSIWAGKILWFCDALLGEYRTLIPLVLEDLRNLLSGSTDVLTEWTICMTPLDLRIG